MNSRKRFDIDFKQGWKHASKIGENMGFSGEKFLVWGLTEQSGEGMDACFRLKNGVVFDCEISPLFTSVSFETGAKEDTLVSNGLDLFILYSGDGFEAGSTLKWTY